MQRIITYLKKVLAVGIAGIVLLITLNNALFLHYHINYDGSLVSHAHPFVPTGEKNSPIQGHHHTAFEIILLDSLMTLALSSFIFFFILAVFSGHLIGGSIQPSPLQSAITAIHNKAPPVVQ